MHSAEERAEILEKLFAAAMDAAKIVMRIYAEPDVGMELKGPNDPVTRADREANALLLERLAKELPGIPIVAEESAPSDYAGFAKSRNALFVDPVDGTREFIAKNGEFAVMIGYAEDGDATIGVIVCPAFAESFLGAKDVGAFRVDGSGTRRKIHVTQTTELAEARCAVSRFHRSKTVDAKLSALGVKELVTTGGAGIKAVRVASGVLDMYAHPSRGPVKLWDACAPDAIVRAAGGIHTDASGRKFDYRGAVAQNEGTLAANPTLHASAVERFATVVPLEPYPR